MRTSKIAIFIRATVIVFAIYMMMATLWNSITNTNFWSVTEMAISAVLTVLLFGGFAWAVTNVGMALMYGRSRAVSHNIRDFWARVPVVRHGRKGTAATRCESCKARSRPNLKLRNCQDFHRQ